ncbi:hypothetical protein AX774_g4392 [Zancudomyces culisetae]|uniref:Uncharacterized protein n=1 Tax=Zancudomyces culisetae TaxID=1213189 RepID=A0A1R1PME6_ZANCU|nr:hypothetical protein AX774_g4392 [Zancudomyces culisetae]|eukprot:OMH82141.1 hypothetical protein AX774_g4392 [Zancudomyces culisetae]
MSCKDYTSIKPFLNIPQLPAIEESRPFVLIECPNRNAASYEQQILKSLKDYPCIFKRTSSSEFWISFSNHNDIDKYLNTQAKNINPSISGEPSPISITKASSNYRIHRLSISNEHFDTWDDIIGLLNRIHQKYGEIIDVTAKVCPDSNVVKSNLIVYTRMHSSAYVYSFLDTKRGSIYFKNSTIFMDYYPIY